MTFEVKLYKKSVTYKDRDGAEKRVFNLYAKVGTVFIPIEVVYFPNDKCEGRDPAFANRRAIIEAVCERLPDREPRGKRNDIPVADGNEIPEPPMPF